MRTNLNIGDIISLTGEWDGLRFDGLEAVVIRSEEDLYFTVAFPKQHNHDYLSGWDAEEYGINLSPLDDSVWETFNKKRCWNVGYDSPNSVSWELINNSETRSPYYHIERKIQYMEKKRKALGYQTYQLKEA